MKERSYFKKMKKKKIIQLININIKIKKKIIMKILILRQKRKDILEANQ